MSGEEARSQAAGLKVEDRVTFDVGPDSVTRYRHHSGTSGKVSGHDKMGRTECFASTWGCPTSSKGITRTCGSQAVGFTLEGKNLHDGQAVAKVVQNTTLEGVGKSVVALDKHGDRIDRMR